MNMRRRVILLTGLLIAFGLGAVAQNQVARPSKPATAAPKKKPQKKNDTSPQKRRANYIIPDGVYRICASDNNRYCLDNYNLQYVNGNDIILWESNQGNNQKWKVQNVNGGIVIRSMGNENMVIDNYNNQTCNRNNIQLWEYNGTAAQLWLPEQVAGKNNVYVLRNSRDSRYCIDIPWGELKNGNSIILHEYKGGGNQQLYFQRIK